MKLITGIWAVKEDKTSLFLNLCKIAKEFAQQEKGCISFSFTEYKDVENTYLFFEEWQDQEAIDFHIAQWYFIEFMEKSKPMLSANPVMKIYNVDNIVNL